MQCDYYAFRRAKLGGSLKALEQAAEAFEEAKQRRDRNARDQAENQMKRAAEEAVKIEPHLAYLWYEACNSEFNNSIRDAWQKQLTATPIPSDFRFAPDMSGVDRLPSLSFMLYIPFRLQKPYLSKDERDFHLLDNPLRKEKVFQTPMVASTSWKGALRAAMAEELVAWWYKLDESGRRAEEFAHRRFRLALLFGDEKGEEPGGPKGLAQYLDKVGGEKASKVFRQKVRTHFCIKADDPMPHFQGCLHFFPAFFDQIGLEVINPHDRKTGVGARGPILMECVPQGTTGEFLLLYVPFGLSEQSENDVRNEVAKDLEVLAQGVKTMFTLYGFGAKTSSGFGVAEDWMRRAGKLVIRDQVLCEATTTPAVNLPESQVSRNEVRQLQTDIEQFVTRFGLIDLPKWTNDELKRSDWGRKRQSEYKRLRARHPDWDDATGSWKTKPEENESIMDKAESVSAPSVSECTFRTLSELSNLARRVAEELRKAGAS